MDLRSAAARYSAARDLAPSTAYQLDRAARDLAGHAGDLDVAEITAEHINAWIAARRQQLAPKTLRNRRASILSLLRWCEQVGHRGPLGQVDAVRLRPPRPEAWTAEELERLRKAASMMPGYLANGVPRKLYFWTLLSVAYDTGLRRSDLLGLRWDCVRGQRIYLTVEKTGQPHVAEVAPSTLAGLREIVGRLRQNGEDGHEPLAWPHHINLLYHWLHRLCRTAGVRYGALQKLRRTGATHVEQEQPGAASRYLGHATPGLAQRHYIDASQTVRPIRPAG